MSRYRCGSQVVATILLVAISIVAFTIAAHSLFQYMSKQAQADPVARVTTAKLILISSLETINGTSYAVFRVDVGVVYTGEPIAVATCLRAVNLTSTSFTVVELPSCSAFTVSEGQRVYSTYIRIPRASIQSLGCARPESCPLDTEWTIAIYYYAPAQRRWEYMGSYKPVYIIP